MRLKWKGKHKPRKRTLVGQRHGVHINECGKLFNRFCWLIKQGFEHLKVSINNKGFLGFKIKIYRKGLGIRFVL